MKRVLLDSSRNTLLLYQSALQLHMEVSPAAHKQACPLCQSLDFVIRKGHTNNTGIHNLRGEALLDILPCRKLEELRAYAKQHSSFLELRPAAVVMDLAPYYHTWIQEYFPEVIQTMLSP